MSNNLRNLIESIEMAVGKKRDFLSDQAFSPDNVKSICLVAKEKSKEAVCFDAGDLFGICEFKVIPEICKLPFGTTWIEGDWSLDVNPYRLGMLCIDNLDGTVDAVGFAMLGKDLWCLVWAFTGFNLQTGEGICHTEDREFLDTSTQHLYALRCFLSAAACINVIRVQHCPDAKLQKARAKKGKQPLFSHWTLELVLTGTVASENVGGTHASPRVHLRRGHARQYAPGKWTWVQPCVVGNKELGMVHKDYKVAA